MGSPHGGYVLGACGSSGGATRWRSAPTSATNTTRARHLLMICGNSEEKLTLNDYEIATSCGLDRRSNKRNKLKR
ncbi:unnamed protein product [Urochloa humidicola]